MEKKCKIVQTKADFCKKKTLRRTRKVFPFMLAPTLCPHVEKQSDDSKCKNWVCNKQFVQIFFRNLHFLTEIIVKVVKF